MFHGSLEAGGGGEGLVSGGLATLPVAVDTSPGPVPHAALSGRCELESRIVGCLQRRVRAVEVEVCGERTVVRGVTSTWHDRQLAEQAILKQVGGPVEFAIRVGN